MFYEGIVERDDVEFGFVKVRIFSKHNRDKTILPTDDLPNAKIVYSGESNIDEISYYRTICNGTWVICGFLDNDEQYPIVLGSIVKTVDTLPNFSDGFTDENGEHPSQTGTTIPSEAKTNYPNNRVLKTKKHLIEYDDTDGEERINIYHHSGSFIQFESDGSITEEVQADKFLTIESDLTIIVQGDVNITGANINATASGNIAVEGTNVTVDSINAAITAPTITITGTTALNLISSTLISMTAPIINTTGLFTNIGILSATDFNTPEILSLNLHIHDPGTYTGYQSTAIAGKSGIPSDD